MGDGGRVIMNVTNGDDNNDGSVTMNVKSGGCGGDCVTLSIASRYNDGGSDNQISGENRHRKRVYNALLQVAVTTMKISGKMCDTI